MSDTPEVQTSVGDRVFAVIVGITMAVLFIGIAVTGFRDWDAEQEQLVSVKATSGWYWCGKQIFVKYKTASVSIDTPEGTFTWYGDVLVNPVKSCGEKP